jgi:hypothetical protein
MTHPIECILAGICLWLVLCLLAPLFRLDPETREIRRRLRELQDADREAARQRAEEEEEDEVLHS